MTTQDISENPAEPDRQFQAALAADADVFARNAGLDRPHAYQITPPASVPDPSLTFEEWWQARQAEDSHLKDKYLDRHAASHDGHVDEHWFVQCCEWLCETLGIRHIHIRDARRTNAEGFPDLFMYSNTGVMFRECKAHSSIRPAQREFRHALKAAGYDCEFWWLEDLVNGRVARELWAIRWASHEQLAGLDLRRPDVAT
jgi:hypothetical protein